MQFIGGRSSLYESEAPKLRWVGKSNDVYKLTWYQERGQQGTNPQSIILQYFNWDYTSHKNRTHDDDIFNLRYLSSYLLYDIVVYILINKNIQNSCGRISPLDLSIDTRIPRHAYPFIGSRSNKVSTSSESIDIRTGP